MIRTLMTTRMITAKEWNYVTTESIEGENNAVVAEVPFFLSSDKLRLGVQFSTPFFDIYLYMYNALCALSHRTI